MFEWIEFIVCFGEGTTPDNIKLRCRDVGLVYPRQLIFYFANFYKCGTLSWIGAKYGLDHATVLHSIKSIRNYIQTDKAKKVRISYYNSLIKKVSDLFPAVNDISKVIDPLARQISKLESRSINLGLQIAFLKAELTKLELMKTE